MKNFEVKSSKLRDALQNEEWDVTASRKLACFSYNGINFGDVRRGLIFVKISLLLTYKQHLSFAAGLMNR